MSRSRSSTGPSAASTKTLTTGFMPTAPKRQPIVLSRATVTGVVSAPAVTEQHAPPHALKRALTCPSTGSEQDARIRSQRKVSQPAPTSLRWGSRLPTPETQKPSNPKRHRRAPTPYPGAKSAPHVLPLPGNAVHDPSSVDVEALKHDADEYDGFADNEAEDLPEPTIDTIIPHARLLSQETGYFDAKTHINPANAYYSYAFAQGLSSDDHGSRSSSMRKDSASLPYLSCDDTSSANSDQDTYKDPRVVEGTFRHCLPIPPLEHPGKLNISTQDLQPQQPATEAELSVHSTCLSPTSPNPAIPWIEEQVQSGLRHPITNTSEVGDLPSPQIFRLDPSYIATMEGIIYHEGEPVPMPTLSYDTILEVAEDGCRTLVISTDPPPEGLTAGRGDLYGDAPSHTPNESELTNRERFWLASNHDEHKLDPWELCLRLQFLADQIEEVESDDRATKAGEEF